MTLCNPTCRPQIVDKYPAHYVVWGACAVEVELDVLTGHYQISQVDYLNDTGTRSVLLRALYCWCLVNRL